MLTISNLFKSYDNHEILHGINLEVKEGEFVSLLGPSGCGKTTTLRCIAGLERPDTKSGPITLGNLALSSASAFISPEKRGFGMVFQSYAVWPHMSVADNVSFPLKMAKKNRDEITKKTNETLELVQLKGFEHRFGHELSGGQQQRVALARALVMSPKLLLLDEPLSNLDVLLREELKIEIQRLQKKLKLTTILVTHDQREALSLSDRIIVMNKGKIEAEGDPQSLYSKPMTPFVSQFLLGSQAVKKKNGAEVLLVPRRWAKDSKGVSFTIQSRLYLGNEFEYWATNEEWLGPVKFYSSDFFEIQSAVGLSYSG